MLSLNDIKSNVLLYTAAKEVLYHLDAESRQYEKLTASISEIDSIADFQSFQRDMKLFKQKSITMPRVIRYGGEADEYGYFNQLLKYAKRDKDRLVYIPMFEHGIRFGETPWPYVHNSISYACQGSGRIDEIHTVDPWKPVFVLGPYIHYVTGYYSPERIKKQKEKLGKTLLVFPSHTWELDSTSGEGNRTFDIVYKKYAKQFGTIMVCCYWNDLEAPVVEAFRSIGAMLVSAGFRGDQNFARRLRTIIELADAVVVDDLGTNMGFCRYLNKPVYLECASSRFPDNGYFTMNFNRFYEAFYSNNMEFSEEQLQQQDKLYKFER